MKSLRIEARLRNNVLWHAIFDEYKSVNEFCRRHRIIHGTSVGGLLNLKCSPKTVTGEWREIAVKLSRIFKMVPEDLFPEHLYQLTTTKAVVEVEPMMLPIGRSVLNLPAPEDPVDDRFKREINEHLAKLICGLSSREEKVIRMKYGIREDREHTLEEIGEYFRITAGRVHQIESKALRKLRHPSRSNKLRSWLETKKGE